MSITAYEKEQGIHEWHCKSCGGYFDNLDPVSLEKTCAFCDSPHIEPIMQECSESPQDQDSSRRET